MKKDRIVMGRIVEELREIKGTLKDFRPQKQERDTRITKIKAITASNSQSLAEKVVQFQEKNDIEFIDWSWNSDGTGFIGFIEYKKKERPTYNSTYNPFAFQDALHQMIASRIK